MLSTTINIGNVVAGSATLPHPVVSPYFYMRWTGFLVPSLTGKYTLGVNASDGVAFFIGSYPLVSNIRGTDTANSSLAYTHSQTILLTAGVYYPVTIEWQHGAGSSYELQVAWTPPLGSIALIPTGNWSSVTSSLSGYLSGSAWQGTSGLWYPSGGSATYPAPAGAGLPTALSGDILIGDGLGNVEDSGVQLADILTGGGVWQLLTGEMSQHQVAPWGVASVGIDTGISRISAGVLAIGDGAWGDASGTLELANIVLSGTFKDSTGSAGTSGYILSSTGTGTQWVAASGGGGGGYEAGTAVTLGTRGGGSANTNWAAYTMEGCIFGEQVINPCASWKIRLTAIGGTGISIHNCVLVKTARSSLVALTVTPITFNGGSLPYVLAFSGKSATNPLYLDSDVISEVIDTLHDWFFCIYLDSDGTGYNAALSLWNTDNPWGYSSSTPPNSGIVHAHMAGNQIPAVSGSVFAISGGTVPLVVAVISETGYTGS